uniref:Phosphatidylethanolamine-binding protein n=1 Tax=viral metagenome TaxID=1070528 RepID=A0A6C0LQZ9_9ZZZZ
MSLEIYLHGNKMKNKEIYDLKYTQDKPTYNIVNTNINDYYSIIMIDPDAPNRINPIYKYVLHWLIINNDQTFVSFIPPNPPKGSGKHRYCFILFKQKSYLKNIKIINERHNFNWVNFALNNNMEIISCIYFETERK